MATDVSGGAGTGAETQGGLRRAIGPRMLLFFIIGDILGAGIYAISGRVAGQVGGAIWLPFLVAFILAALTAGSYAELVGKYPQAAGAALYTHKAFRVPFVTFIVTFAVMLSGITSASAAARAFSGNYLRTLVGASSAFPFVLATVIAIGFIAVLCLINFVGVRESVRVNLGLTLVELSGLLVIIGIGVLVLFGLGGGQDVDPSRAFNLDSGSRTALLGVIGGTAIAFFALLGFEDSVNMAEESEQPSRNYPRALFGGLVITGVIYLLVAFVSAMVVPPRVLATSSGPLLEVVQRAGIAFPPRLFALIALLAVSNTALMNLLMASRLLYGMANQRVVPSFFGRVHRTRQTPYVAIAFTLLVAAVLISSTSNLGPLADTTVLLLLVIFAIVNVAVLVLRRESVPHEHFRTPIWAPVLGAVASLVLATPITGRGWPVYRLALILLAIGVAFWVVNRFVAGRAEVDPERLAG